MYILELISLNNGWVMAFVGIIIVFSCLAILSFTLSRLHILLDLWDKKNNFVQGIKEKKIKDVTLTDSLKNLIILVNFKNAVRQFNILIKTMHHPFSLPGLIELAKKRGLYYPHSSVNAMLKVKLIRPDGKGYYYWDAQIYKNIIRKGRA